MSARRRISFADLKDYMNEIASTIPLDANVNDVPEDQRHIIETNLHIAAHTHVARWSAIVRASAKQACTKRRLTPRSARSARMIQAISTTNPNANDQSTGGAGGAPNSAGAV